MNKPRILRKRYIPDEVVDISGDEILYIDEEFMVTKWSVIRPREDISGGISFCFLKEGYKISRFNDKNGEFAYWYCDIVDVDYNSAEHTYVFTDLLVDVKIIPDGKVIVLDLEEVADALENKIITQKQACDALRKLNKLLDIIYKGEFPPKPVVDFLVSFSR